MTDNVEKIEALPEIEASVPALYTAPSAPIIADPYHAISMVPISPEQQRKLEEPVCVDQIEILPTGEIYLPQVFYRRRLNDVFGAGRWALMPRGAYSMHDGTLTREYALIVNGAFVSEVVGEADYFEDNDRYSYATAAESLKSNALRRLCKDLGIAWECWDKRFADEWRDKHAVKVHRRDQRKNPYQWRRADAKPFYDEDGAAPQTIQSPQRASATQQPSQEARPNPTNTTASSAANEQSAAAPASTGFDWTVKPGEKWEAGIVERVSTKSGKDEPSDKYPNGREWMKFGVLIHGQWYSTFDKGLGDDATEYCQSGRPIWFKWKASGNYKNLLDLVTAESVKARGQQLPEESAAGTIDDLPF